MISRLSYETKSDLTKDHILKRVLFSITLLIDYLFSGDSKGKNLKNTKYEPQKVTRSSWKDN